MVLHRYQVLGLSSKDKPTSPHTLCLSLYTYNLTARVGSDN